MNDFAIIGHRGACAHEPENTLRSVQRAIDDAADMIEIDVRLVDGEVIVIHDDTLGRTTDGSGPLYEKSFQQLRELDAGRGEKIPTLQEVLDLTLDKLTLNIEIKDTQVTPAVCELLMRAPELYPARIIISSFYTEAIREARKLLPNVPIGVLARNDPADIEEMFALAKELDAVSVHPNVNSVSEQMVEVAHSADHMVLPYTARTPEQLQRLLDCGADGCFADDPAWAREFAQSNS